MLDIPNQNQSLGNGKDDSIISAWPSVGLANTNPSAWQGTTLGAGVPSDVVGGAELDMSRRLAQEVLQPTGEPVWVTLAAAGAGLQLRSLEYVQKVETKIPKRAKALKPAGQVVLFKKIMEDWGFKNLEAATLLGFGAESDIGDIYLGIKPVGHRDANDRLRAVLRIAADLDALFQEVAAIRDWLTEPQRDLNGETPRSLLTEGSMENLLRVKYYAAYLSGR